MCLVFKANLTACIFLSGEVRSLIFRVIVGRCVLVPVILFIFAVFYIFLILACLTIVLAMFALFCSLLEMFSFPLCEEFILVSSVKLAWWS